MRVVVASLPASVITLALFCLMQYLISGRTQPIPIPADGGFVHLIHVEPAMRESDTDPAMHTLPRQTSAPAETPPWSAPMAADFGPPGLPSLSMPLSEPSSVELAGAPVLVPDFGLDEGARPEESELKEAIAGVTRGSMTRSAAAVDGQAAEAAFSQAGEVAARPPAGGSYGNEVIPLLRFDPVYPRKAAQAGTEGWVKVEFTITAQGDVIDAVVVDSRPRRVFNNSALKAIQKWQFKPRVIDGRPVQTRATQVIEFTLAKR